LAGEAVSWVPGAAEGGTDCACAVKVMPANNTAAMQFRTLSPPEAK
jgi:hypothetical protein